jgi:hypothetical protein
MHETPRDDVRALREQAARLRAEAEDLVRGLSPAQLDWRPPDGRWSIADNLDHLTVAGRWYLKQIDRSLADAQARGLAPRAPARLGAFMRLLIWGVEPPVRRLRVRAPAGYEPAPDHDPAAVLAAYAAHHAALGERLARARDADLGRARARSPLTRRLRVSLHACISMMLAHERRHLWQACQVRAEAAFPPA